MAAIKALRTEHEELSIMYDALHAKYCEATEQRDHLSARCLALDAHVKRLHIIIGKRYTEVQHGTSKWARAAAYAKLHGITVQRAMERV